MGSTATDAWNRKYTAKELRVLELVVDKLLDARLGYSGRDTSEQRQNTMTWAKVFLEAWRQDPKASNALIDILREAPPPKPRDEKAELIADIRRMAPMLEMAGHHDLAEDIKRAMDMLDTEAAGDVDNAYNDPVDGFDAWQQMVKKV